MKPSLSSCRLIFYLLWTCSKCARYSYRTRRHTTSRCNAGKYFVFRRITLLEHGIKLIIYWTQILYITIPKLLVSSNCISKASACDHNKVWIRVGKYSKLHLLRWQHFVGEPPSSSILCEVQVWEEYPTKVCYYYTYKTWQPVTLEEMKGFVAVILTMGNIKLNNLKDCWSTNDTADLPFFQCVILYLCYNHCFWVIRLGLTHYFN